MVHHNKMAIRGDVTSTPWQTAVAIIALNKRGTVVADFPKADTFSRYKQQL